MGHGAPARGEDDLEDVGAHGRHGGDAQDVDEDRKGEEPPADAHDARGQPHQGAARHQEHPGDPATAGHEIKVEPDDGRDLDRLQLARQAPDVGALGLAAVRGGTLGGVGLAGGPARFQEVEQGVEAQEPQHDRVNRGDEGVADDRVQIVQPAVQYTAAGGADDGADQKDHRQRDRDVAELAVDDAAHDRLGEDVEQVGADRENALDARAHQRRGDDEPAARPDAAGDQAGHQTDADRGQEDRRGIEGRAVGGFASQHRRQVVGQGDAADHRRHREQQQYEEPPPVPQDPVGHLQLPLRVVPGAQHHEASKLLQKFHLHPFSFLS